MIEQGSPEWHQMRLGKVTASRIADLMAKTKGGYGASRDNYLAELVCERLTGKPTDGYMNDAMRRGSEMEPFARMMYEAQQRVTVDQVAFIDHPTIPMSGASPDGLVSDVGMVEFKCPNTKTHLDFLLSGKIPGKYLLQMQWQMECAGREWVDFVSFDNRLPEHLQISIKRVARSESEISTIKTEVTTFLNEVDDTIERLGKMYGF